MRIYCTMRAKTASARWRAVNIHVWSDSIASSFCHLFAWKEWKHFVVSINVPPPQLWAGQHAEMFVNHVTVFSQSVTRIRLSHTILYGWWLLEEGTSRNVPIAGFEMILREDYKSRDEVEGLIIFPKYHFKPQDTGNIPWCSRQQSRHLLYCMALHYLARLRHSLSKFTKLSIFFQRGFPLSCAQYNAYPLYCAPQCNAYPLYCARNKQPVRGKGGQHTCLKR